LWNGSPIHLLRQQAKCGASLETPLPHRYDRRLGGACRGTDEQMNGGKRQEHPAQI